MFNIHVTMPTLFFGKFKTIASKKPTKEVPVFHNELKGTKRPFAIKAG